MDFSQPDPPPEQQPWSTLPISMPSLPSFPHETTHYIRLRRNTPLFPTPLDSRTLFLKNVPIDSTNAHIRDIVTQLIGAGRVERVAFPNVEEDISRKAGFDPESTVRVIKIGGKRKRGDEEVTEHLGQEDIEVREHSNDLDGRRKGTIPPSQANIQAQ